MAWFNPATWAPVDALQNSIGSVTRPGPGQLAGGSSYGGFSSQAAKPQLAGAGATPSRGGQSASGPTSQPQSRPISSGPVAGAGGSSGAAAGPAVDPAVLASYDQAIGNTNSAIGRLGTQLNSGNSAIDASYQNALNQLLLGRNQSQATYNTNKQQTAHDYVSAKNTIGANAGQSLSGVQRLLGSRGAGGGSAYNQAAPEAVTRQATLQRNDVGNTFGQNNQALDTNWGNYVTGYDNSVLDVNSQHDQQRQGLQNSIETNRASLLQTLAQLSAQRDVVGGGNGVGAAQPFLDQANAALNSQADYHVAPINYQTQAYNAPALSTYAANPQAAPTYQGQSPTNDFFSPYLAALLGKRQQQGL